MVHESDPTRPILACSKDDVVERVFICPSHPPALSAGKNGGSRFMLAGFSLTKSFFLEKFSVRVFVEYTGCGKCKQTGALAGEMLVNKPVSQGGGSRCEKS